MSADYDNDGDVDILVLRGAWLARAGGHPNSLLQNLGRGRFRDVTFDVGLGDVHYPTQTAAWADYDNDGDLDLYIGNEPMFSGRPDSEDFDAASELEAPSQLFRNQGDGTFVDVAQAAGVENHRGAKGVVWGDYNADRLPDLYVSNLLMENRLYHNNGDGTFTDVATKLGVQGPVDSFPAWFWDFDNDGHLDIYVCGYPHPAPPSVEIVDKKGVYSVAAECLDLPHDADFGCLYRNDGHASFLEVAAETNLDRVALTMGCNFGDLDHDGYPDFYLGTGFTNYEALIPNLMFLNQRGAGFVDVTSAGGFGHLQKGHGIAFADLDHDGDQDVIANMGGGYAGDGFANVLYENPGFASHWIAVKLIGTQSNRSAIGARIQVDINESGRRRSVYKWVNSGGSFGANPLRQQIGVGLADRIETLTVYWPTSDQTQQFHNVEVDQFIEITESGSEYRRLPYARSRFQKGKQLW